MGQFEIIDKFDMNAWLLCYTRMNSEKSNRTKAELISDAAERRGSRALDNAQLLVEFSSLFGAEKALLLARKLKNGALWEASGAHVTLDYQERNGGKVSGLPRWKNKQR